MPTEPSPTPPNDVGLTLQTLGPAALFPPGDHKTAKPLLELGKPLALIIYVACSPGRAARREHLQDLIWSDLDTEAGRHAVRQALWYIRKKAPFPLLEARGDTVSIVAPLAVDRDAILAAAEAANLEQVVALYHADFVPDFAAPGGAEFERWAAVERARLRSTFNRSAETLIRQWLSSGRLHDAQALARRLRDLDPHNESAWRLLLESLISAGDTVTAMIEADALETLLAEEEQEPEPATTGLLRMARKGRATDSATAEGPHALVLPLVGRQHEFATILDAWEHCRAGKPAHVHISAPPGLGKSRLVNDVRARLRTLRARVVFVRASIGQRDVPFAMASELAGIAANIPGARGISPGSAAALVAMNPTLSSLFSPSPDTSHGAEALRRRTLAISELVEATSSDHPLAILIDDLHWCDDASRAVLQGIMDGLGRLRRVLIVTTGRTVAQGRVGTEGTLDLRLRELSEEHVAELMAALAALPSVAWARKLPAMLRDATGGSPLLLLESLRLLLDQGMLSRDERNWGCSSPDQLAGAIIGGSALGRRVRALDPAESRLLALVATAGTPLPLGILACADRGRNMELTSALTTLEQKGLVTGVNDEWVVTHDEIASAVLDETPPEAQRELARALGTALADEPGTDPGTMRRAGRLLLAAGEHRGLRDLFQRFARSARRSGDRRANQALAEDFLGAAASAVDLAGLVRALPLPARVGLYTRQRLVTAALIAAFAPAAALGVLSAGRQPPRIPDDELVVLVARSDTGFDAYRIPLFEAEWPGVTSIEVRGHRPEWRVPDIAGGQVPVLRPGSNEWYTLRTFVDSTGIDMDVVAVGRDGSMQRVSPSKGDESMPVFSPDGRFFAMATARWDSLDHMDVGVTEIASGLTRAVTRTVDQEGVPSWSPDGTRLAYTRTDWETNAVSSCTAHVDGTNEVCAGLAGATYAQVAGWTDGHTVLIHVVSGQGGFLYQQHAGSAIATQLDAPGGTYNSVSPSGRWAVCWCDAPGQPAGVLAVVLLGQPGAPRPIRVADSPGRILATWMPARMPRYLDTLKVAPLPSPLMVGVPHGLEAIGVDPAGRRLDGFVALWSSGDPPSASVDPSSGTVVARTPGTLQVRLGSAGWREATQMLAVNPRFDSVATLETWGELDTTAWTPFGTPPPGIVARSSLGRSLANNGDGKFASGVLSRATYPTGRGIAIEADVSIPITLGQWQFLQFGLTTIDPVTLSSDALASGAIDWSGHRPQECAFAYPVNRQGPTYGDSVGALTREGGAAVRAPEALRRGVPHRVRVQLLPDGRCAVALDGRAIAVAPNRLRARAVHLVAAGSSYATSVLLGPITVRIGVPDDIDWAAFEGLRKP